jgi:hypothetical protein
MAVRLSGGQSISIVGMSSMEDTHSRRDSGSLDDRHQPVRGFRFCCSQFLGYSACLDSYGVHGWEALSPPATVLRQSHHCSSPSTLICLPQGDGKCEQSRLQLLSFEGRATIAE